VFHRPCRRDGVLLLRHQDRVETFVPPGPGAGNRRQHDLVTPQSSTEGDAYESGDDRNVPVRVVSIRCLSVCHHHDDQGAVVLLLVRLVVRQTVDVVQPGGVRCLHEGLQGTVSEDVPVETFELCGSPSTLH